MNNRYLFLFLLMLFTCSVNAQKQNFWSATFFIGLNSPLVNDADTTKRVLYEDELALLKVGAATITGSALVPPLSFDVALNLNEHLAFGTRLIYQAHQENTTIQSLTGSFISESKQTKQALLLFAEANYTWYQSAPFSLSSGGGVGFGWSNIETGSSKNASAFCFDLRLVTMRYELCCGWSLLVDGRYTSSPTGINKTAGYNIALGVAYSFNQ